MTLGKKLQAARKTADWRPDQVAKQLGISSHAYRRYERDEVMPKFDTVVQIAELLGVTLDELWTGRESDTPRLVEVRVKPGEAVVIRGEEADTDAPYRPPFVPRAVPKAGAKTKKKRVNK